MGYIFRVQLDGPIATGWGRGGGGAYISITQALVKTAGYGQLLHVIE